MSGTARIGLPFLSAGQAQKEVTHNAALQTLDSLVAGAVEEPPRADPPATPAFGACYIVATSPTGEWAGKPQYIAAFTSAGWQLLPPVEGMAVFVRSEGITALYRAGSWELGQVRASSVLIGGQQVLGSRAAAIASATGGTSVDSEARAVVDQILGALRQHGLIEP